jgi:hypothetical protein
MSFIDARRSAVEHVHVEGIEILVMASIDATPAFPVSAKRQLRTSPYAFGGRGQIVALS